MKAIRALISFPFDVLKQGLVSKDPGNDKKSHQMAQTCELSANSVVEDAGLYHFMLSSDIPNILGVKKNQ